MSALNDHPYRDLIRTKIAALRPKLMDVSRRNPLINNTVRSANSSYIRVVDELPEFIWKHLVEENKTFLLTSLPPLDIDPPDELRGEFLDALDIAKISDEEYLKGKDRINSDIDDRAFEKEAALERNLKDKVRELLGYAPRAINADISSLSEHARLHDIDPSVDLSSSSIPVPDDGRYHDDKLQTLMLPRSLVASCRKIISKDNLMRTERGVNALYLVLGYLSWRDPKSNDLSSTFLSPILLLPVYLKESKSRGESQYEVSLREAPTVNPVLRHKLLTEFGVTIPALDDEPSLVLDDLFTELPSLLPKDLKPTVRLRAMIGLYPYAGIDLFNDLDPEGIDFESFDALSQILSGVSSSGSEPFLEDYSDFDLDSDLSQTLVPSVPLDADSTQFLALLKVASGQNLAIEGPPGSGKSQTIVNMISSSLARGEKVLFVAQKNTALQVVNNRLSALGLGDYILPLLSNQGDSAEFYETLERRVRKSMLNLDENRLLESQDKLKQRKTQLQEYIAYLRTNVRGTSLTNHELMGMVIKYAPALEMLPPLAPSFRVDTCDLPVTIDIDFIGRLAAIVDGWLAEYSVVELSSDSIWDKIKTASFTFAELEKVKHAASDLIAHLEALADLSDDYRNYQLEDLIGESFCCARQAFDQLIQQRIDWAYFDDSIVTASQLSVLREARDKRTRISEEYNLEWPELVFLSSFQHLRALIDFCEVNGIELVSTQSLEDLSVTFQRQIESDNALIAINNKVVREIGFSLPITALKIALSDVFEVENFEMIDLLEPSKGGLAFAEDIILRRIQIIKDLREATHGVPLALNFDELTSLRNDLMDRSFLGFFSKKLRSARALAAQLVGLPKFDRMLVVPAVQNIYEKASLFQSDTFLSRSFSLTRIPEAESYLEQLSKLLYQLKRKLIKENIDEVLFLEFLGSDSAKDLVCHASLLKTLGSDTTWDSLKSAVDEKLEKQRTVERLISSIIGEPSITSLVENIPVVTLKFLHENFKVIGTLEDQRCEEAKLREEVLQNPEDKAAADFVSDLEQVFGFYKKIAPHHQFGGHSSSLPRFFDIATHTITGWGTLKSEVRNNWLPVTSDQLLSTVLKSITELVHDDEGFTKLMQYRSFISSIKSQNALQLLEKIHSQDDELRTGKTFALYILSQLKRNMMSAEGEKIYKFSGASLDRARADLKRADAELKKLAAQTSAQAAHVRLSKVTQGVARGKKSDYSELSLIQHQLGLKRKMPPSRLVKRAIKALVDLHPCWMMVPNAVASTLPRESLFDLLIIDEASQMPPEYALSCLMRAKQVVVVGDTNQLPPTNFFRGLATTDSDVSEEESDDIIEESILELANAQFRPKHRLAWHYRSRHESLIAFSNFYVYGNDLIIFPSSHKSTENLGVSLVECGGLYQSSINVQEAKRVVEDAVQFMASNPDTSLGIVTMNAPQQEQIEAMMFREIDSNEAVAAYIEKWKDQNGGLESFFIKNLENVQGDERDAIFISTVYGKNKEGKFYQGFGPINGKSGKRRLNVLFSRAKEHIRTFTSIPFELFSPKEANEGALLLRRWLEYSKTDRLGQSIAPTQIRAATDSPFEDAVIEVIEELGYEATPQVGVANYFIDIGVSHPDYPYGFLCGVECDGASYHSSRSARDRDILRQEVLERMGWTLYRIWSTDWFKNFSGERDRLRTYLENLFKSLDAAARTKEVKTFEAKKALETTSGIPDLFEEEAEGYESSNPDSNLIEVQLGDEIEIKYENGPFSGNVSRYFLTHSSSAVARSGYAPLSMETPLAQALLGCVEGSNAHFLVNNLKVDVHVLRVARAE